MNMKTVIAAGVMVGLFATAAVSPLGYPAFSAKLAEKELEEARLGTYQFNLASTQRALVESVNAYNEARTFDVYYGDVTRVYDVLANIAGISVSSITKVDPANGYVDAGVYTEGDTPLAVEVVMLTDDVASAVKVIEKMELPVYEIDWQSPNVLSVIFLTGGEV